MRKLCLLALLALTSCARFNAWLEGDHHLLGSKGPYLPQTDPCSPYWHSIPPTNYANRYWRP